MDSTDDRITAVPMERRVAAEILEHSTRLWQLARAERARIHQESFGSEWLPLFEIDLFSDNIAGHATSFARRGKVPATLPASLLEDRRFLDWFSARKVDYPIVCAYVLAIEALRARLLGVVENPGIEGA